MKLLLAGGTGLIGQAFLARAQSTNLHITAVGRRPTGLATEDIVADFADLPAMPSARVAVCTLGTTIRAAGSQDAFRAIDFDAVIAFATAAKNGGCRTLSHGDCGRRQCQLVGLLLSSEGRGGARTFIDALPTPRHRAARAATRQSHRESASRNPTEMDGTGNGFVDAGTVAQIPQYRGAYRRGVFAGADDPLRARTLHSPAR